MGPESLLHKLPHVLREAVVDVLGNGLGSPPIRRVLKELLGGKVAVLAVAGLVAADRDVRMGVVPAVLHAPPAEPGSALGALEGKAAVEVEDCGLAARALDRQDVLDGCLLRLKGPLLHCAPLRLLEPVLEPLELRVEVCLEESPDAALEAVVQRCMVLVCRLGVQVPQHGSGLQVPLAALCWAPQSPVLLCELNLSRGARPSNGRDIPRKAVGASEVAAAAARCGIRGGASAAAAAAALLPCASLSDFPAHHAASGVLGFRPATISAPQGPMEADVDSGGSHRGVVGGHHVDQLLHVLQALIARPFHVSKKLLGDYAQGVDVGGGGEVVLLAAGELGGNEAQGATRKAPSERGLGGRHGVEVAQDEPLALGEQHVARLDVAVDEAVSVQVLHGLRGVAQEPSALVDGAGARRHCLQPLPKVASAVPRHLQIDRQGRRSGDR